MATIITNTIINFLKKYLSIIVILLLIISITPKTQTTNSLNIIPKLQITNNKNDNSIGNLIINKINLNQKLFPIDSEENSVEKNITILKESIFPPNKDSIIFLAAHSGTGDIAYFERLDELKPDDEIILIYQNKKYKYEVKSSWEERKNGYININKDKKNQLVLTTCSPNKKGFQLIVNCIKKESNS